MMSEYNLSNKQVVIVLGTKWMTKRTRSCHRFFLSNSSKNDVCLALGTYLVLCDEIHCQNGGQFVACPHTKAMSAKQT